MLYYYLFHIDLFCSVVCSGPITRGGLFWIAFLFVCDLEKSGYGLVLNTKSLQTATKNIYTQTGNLGEHRVQKFYYNAAITTVHPKPLIHFFLLYDDTFSHVNTKYIITFMQIHSFHKEGAGSNI